MSHNASTLHIGGVCGGNGEARLPIHSVAMFRVELIMGLSDDVRVSSKEDVREIELGSVAGG